MSYNTNENHYELDEEYMGKLSLEEGPLPRGGFGTFSEPDETSPRLWAEYLKALPKGLSLLVIQARQDMKYCHAKKNVNACPGECIVGCTTWPSRVLRVKQMIQVGMAENARYSAFDGTNIKGGW